MLEGKASEVIREMAETKRLAKDEDLVYVVNLITLLVVGNPRNRRSLARAEQQNAKAIGEMLASERTVFERYLREAREAGYDTGPEVSFERFKEFVEDGERYTIEVETEALIQMEFSVFDEILQCVASRYWSLLNATPDAPDFITCDHPITLQFKDHPPKRAGQ